jgi:hypothetical protein
MYPINPNTTNSLSGGMAVLKPLSYGIDVRTNNQIGLPVPCSSRWICISSCVKATGYGNANILNIKNGTTTLYGHLSEFNKEIAAYVRKKFIKEKVLQIYTFLLQFSVKKKGEIVALSGNSGHLRSSCAFPEIVVIKK